MKTKFYLPALLLVLLGFQVSAATPLSKIDKEKIEHMTAEEKKALLEHIKIRVHEIKEMDKSDLTREQRKELRQELKEMKQEARAISGIYISVGALIIIILLLIIIL